MGVVLQRATEQRRPFDVKTFGHEIRITGTLARDSVIHGGIENELREASRLNRITVDAATASIFEGGADVWVKVVREFFPKCELRYLPSQLGLILLYDDQYRTLHPGSFFDDEE